MHDREILGRLRREEVLFPTQDEDFVEVAPDCQASTLWSRVSQSMPIDRRVESWFNAVKQFHSQTSNEKFFELYDDGKLQPVAVVKRLGPLSAFLSEHADAFFNF